MSETAQTKGVCRRLTHPRVWLTAVLILLTVAVATPAQAQGQSDQRFTLIILGEERTGIAVGRGPITGVGTFKGNQEDPDVGLLSFPSGTLTIRGFFTEESTDFDERSCVGTFVTSGTWVVEEGTGAYEGATGGGRIEGRVKFGTERTAEGCGETQTFAVAVFRLTGGLALEA